eukprot:CAMPEP_0117430682 /NCGR_PEP_ID=MMETSP0758-20121206/10241_1 /TAXON_ID=63605 /ORGANISM="Percolomonas cosmopolitus, Strain AE-1 (ATCC 50343)" /LENGTH=43 /DNA_ID= /DNA_START= /DNA_END= /DNA_ORIENTATION=
MIWDTKKIQQRHLGVNQEYIQERMLNLITFEQNSSAQELIEKA